MPEITIVMLPGLDSTKRIFKPEHLQRMRQMGNVRLNQGKGIPSRDEVEGMLEGADIAITSWGSPPLDGQILAGCPQLKLVAHAAGTVKPIMSSELIDRGIRVCSANDCLARGVAETTLGLAIASLKNIWRLAQDTRMGGWDHMNMKVRELYEVTIGIIGGGLSGRHFIRLLQQFEVKILVYDPFLSEAEVLGMGAMKVSLEQLMQQADVVSIHAPSLPETRHLINAHMLKLMKEDAILINTSRGALVDEEALATELQKGRLWACLDVTQTEPPAADHPFRKLSNVTLIPHIAGATNNGLYRMGSYITRELELFVQGLPLHGEVNLSKLHVMA